MAGLETEIARLGHKDVRVRRRAVRHLFDADVPMALKGFVPLLEDEDPWFRSKALDAHRRWVRSEKDLEPLMADHRRLAAELLEKIDAEDTARELFGDEDNATRAFAAQALCDHEDVHSTMASDPHHSVRCVAGEHSTNEEIISSLMQDPHSNVRRAALANAARNDIEITHDALKVALGSSDPSLRSLAASMAVMKGGELLELACKDSNPKVRSSIAKTMRKSILKVDERVTSLSSSAPDIILRWLRGRYGVKASTLRWTMIEDTSVDSRTRSKLIEQMDGRDDVDQTRLSILSDDDSQLVRIAANNLSASLLELSGERS